MIQRAPSSLAARLASGRTADHVLAGLLVLVVVPVLVFYRVQDFDVFWHLANGRYMVQHGQIVNEEVFSFTRPGTPFSNHEWLAQLLFYGIWAGVGALGIVVFKALLVTLLAVLLYGTARACGASVPWAGVLALLAIVSGVERYRERPELFSLLFVGWLGLVLNGWARGRLGRWWLWTIPGVLALWDVLHGAPYGLLYLGGFAVGETVRSWCLMHADPSAAGGPASGRGPTDLRTLWAVLLGTLAVGLVNPYGLRSYGVFVEFLGPNPLVQATFEFGFPDVHLYPRFWLLLGLFVVATLALGRRGDLPQLVVALGFALLALRYRRAIPLFGLACAPVLASFAAAAAARRGAGKWLRLTAWGAAAALLVYTAHLKFPAGDSPYRLGYAVNGRLLPVGSTRFIADSGLTGPMYNPGHFGGYLAYYLFPGRRIFLYNHHVVFGDAPVTLVSGDFVARYGIEYAVLALSGFDAGVDPAAFRLDRWALVYWDECSMVLVRRTPEHRAFIDRRELRYFTPTLYEAMRRYRASPGTMERLEANPVTAVALAGEIASCIRYYGSKFLADYVAYLLLRHQDRVDPLRAMADVDRALAHNRSNAYLWFAKSRFLLRSARPGEAREALVRAMGLDSDLVARLGGRPAGP